MVNRAVILFLTSLGLAAVPLAQEFPAYQQQNSRGEPASMMSPSRYSNSLSGSVRDVNDQPLRDVRVELRNLSNGMVISFATTSMSGEFEFRQVPQGAYKVVATSGLDEAEERVDVSTLNPTVNLRLARPTAPDVNGHGTVSVAQYQVPEKAREEFRKARDASTKGKNEEAQSHLAKALQIHPNYADALTLRAVLELGAGQADNAVADLHKAIECDGNYSMAYLVLGSAFNMKAQFDDALTVLQRAESLSPESWQNHFEMGKAYAGKNDYGEALRQLDRAQAMAPPDYPVIRLVRAHVFMQLQRFADAVTDLEAYLHKTPNGADADLARKMLEQAKETQR